MTDANIVEIFFYADEFSRAYDRILEQHSLAGGAKPKRKSLTRRCSSRRGSRSGSTP